MVSYKLYGIRENEEKLKNILIKSEFLKDIEKIIEESESKLIKAKYSVFLKRIKDLSFKIKERSIDLGIFSFNFNYPIPEAEATWIKLECILKLSSLKKILFLQYKQPQSLSFFNEIFLKPIKHKEPLVININFKNKKLIKLYKSIKEIIESNSSNTVKLHRIITKKLELEGILFNEGNFQGNDDELSNLILIINKDASEVKVITFKIFFNEEKEKKPVTIRIDLYGKLLIYGNHSEKIINQILNNIEIAITNL